MRFPGMKRKKIRFPAALFSGILLVFLDQYTKYLAAKFLKPGGPVILIRNVLELRYLENRGAAFGMLQNRNGISFVIMMKTVHCFPPSQQMKCRNIVTR